MDRDVGHDEAFLHHVTSDIIEKIEVLPHLWRLVVAGHEALSSIQPRNSIPHVGWSKCDIAKNIDTVLRTNQFVVPFDHILCHLISIVPRTQFGLVLLGKLANVTLVDVWVAIYPRDRKSTRLNSSH